MAIPVRPTPSSPIQSAWGNAVQDQLQKRWRFVPAFGALITGEAQNGSSKTIEITGVPATGVVGIAIMGRVLDPTTTSNYTLTLQNFDGSSAAIGYASGVANRGGSFGPAVLIPGGVNGRQIKYVGSSGSQASIWLNGYYTTDDV